jgi:hypothetical protein
LTFSANLKARPLVLPRLVGLPLPSILPAMTPSCSQATAASSRTPTTPPLSAEPYASLPAGLSTISRLTPPSPSAAVAPPCSLLPGCSSLRPLRSAPRRPPYRRMRRRRRPRRALSGIAVLPPASTARAVYQHHVIEVTGWGARDLRVTPHSLGHAALALHGIAVARRVRDGGGDPSRGRPGRCAPRRPRRAGRAGSLRPPSALRRAAASRRRKGRDQCRAEEEEADPPSGVEVYTHTHTHTHTYIHT